MHPATTIWYSNSGTSGSTVAVCSDWSGKRKRGRASEPSPIQDLSPRGVSCRVAETPSESNCCMNKRLELRPAKDELFPGAAEGPHGEQAQRNTRTYGMQTAAC